MCECCDSPSYILQHGPRMRNILVVDDTPDNLRLLVGMLTEHGYDVRAASDGEFGLESARVTPPDLILLDIRMPDMDGYTVCKELKADEYTRDIPVIFISALDEVTDKVKGFEVGGVDYISKPFQPEEVLVRVATHLDLQRLRKALEEKNAELQHTMEKMRVQNEKMRSVGGLAAGMAHEINNPLGGMMQTANVLANRLVEHIHMPANVKAAEDAGTTTEVIENFLEARGIPRMLHAISEAGQRLTAIVSNMLSFARQSDAISSSHDIADLLDKTLELAATDYDLKTQYDFTRIEIVRDEEENLPSVPCEGSKIQQVLLNLLRNGAQAMQEAGTEGPRFLLRTHREKERKMVTIEIEDNGPGMDEATRKRVFEPFFTTKSEGVGTGLGLSVSYFIITDNHGGEMVVESQPGCGTKFIIRLPLEVKNA